MRGREEIRYGAPPPDRMPFVSAPNRPLLSILRAGRGRLCSDGRVPARIRSTATEWLGAYPRSDVGETGES